MNLTLTPNAVSNIKRLYAEKNLSNYGLRIFIGGGGCSGMQYGMAFEDTTDEENDFVLDCDGVKVMVDAMSSQYLSGAVVDYVDSLMGGGFKVDNPNAVTTCGCGHSFKCQ